MANKIVLRRGIHLGEPAAEDDSLYLEECFVDLPIVHQLKDMESSKCVLLGRTGSGKTAILNHIEETSDHALRINPFDIAFEYISNSNIIGFIVDIGCDLNNIFEMLWKHILCTKAIKCYFENRSIFQKAIDRTLDKSNPAFTYFERYKDKFWIEQDEVLKEITETIEDRLSAELRASLGVEYAKIEAGTSSQMIINSAVKREISNRVRKVVSNLQVRELGRAIEALNHIMENKQKSYYIIIDDLDLDWSQGDVKYQLIKALLESTKSFRKVRNVKVIIALRSDVYEKTLSVSTSESLQPEKFEGITVQLIWTAQELKLLIDKRIEYLFRHQYMKQSVKFAQVFPASIRKIATFDYICMRTLMRPRDLIAFFNVILDRASGSSEITPKYIADAEAEYSKKRYEALCREWKSLHPNIETYLRFLKDKTGKTDIKDISVREVIVDICLQIDDSRVEGLRKDDVEIQCDIYSKRENDSKLFAIAAALLATLYKVGAVEIKLERGDILRACYRNEPIILAEQITIDAAFTVSPMLWRTLGITPNIG